jgi:hypothetical protein|uniref:LicD/FKTN/FKRP nucleotidyltransferase domain-containing protein n=1 Tax=viral metagenome TaxID=1070528 RepID=A0A6C0IM30_9ZZZZ
MAGGKNTSNKLNNTLLYLAQILNNYNIQNWFIAYGTLLGIIRDNSCINNDDDVDIICDKCDYEKIKELLKNNFSLEYGYGINKSKDILKTKSSQLYASIDFYMADIDEQGNFKDNWEKVIWSNCYQNNKLVEYNWNNITLYLPNNAKEKLKGRYGDKWEVPQNNKGPSPKKTII